MFTCGHEEENQKAKEYKQAFENAKPLNFNNSDSLQYDNGLQFTGLEVYPVEELSIDEFIFIMENQRKLRKARK